MLSEQRRKQLDDIVIKMANQNAPQKDVDLIVNDFIAKFANEQPAQPKETFSSQIKESAVKRGEQILKSFEAPTPVQTGLRAVGAGAGFVGDVLFEGLNSLSGGLLKKGTEKVAQAPGVSDVLSKVNDWSQKHPEAAADLGSLVNIASLAPQIKGAQLAGKGAIKTAELAERGIEKTGQGVSKIGETLYKTAIPLNEKEAGLLQKARAGLGSTPRTTPDTALEKGLIGTESQLGVQAVKSANNLWVNKIAPAVKSIPEKINKDELFTSIKNKISKVADASKRTDLKNALEALKDDYKKIKEFSYERAQQIKSELQEFIPQKAWRGSDIAGSYSKLRKMLADEIRQRTYKRLKDVNIKKDYLDYGNLKNLQALGRKAMTGAKLKGGFGSFWSGIWDLTTTPIKTIGGQVLYRAGNGMQFIGPKGIKKLGDYLKNLK